MREILELIGKDLAPTHGRAAGAARTAMAALIASFILIGFRAPACAAGIFLIFLISYDGPYLTIQNGLRALCYQTAGVCMVLLLIIASDNAPIVRCFGIFAFTFLAAFLSVASPRRTLGLNLGVFTLGTLQLFDAHVNANDTVKLALWPVATGALAVACKIVIEYALTKRDASAALDKEIDARIAAISELLSAGADSRKTAARKTIALATYGQTKIVSLLEELQYNGSIKGERRSLLLAPYVSQLLDLASLYAQRNEPVTKTREARRQCVLNALSMLQSRNFTGLSAIAHDADDDEQDPLTRMLWQLRSIGDSCRMDAMAGEEASTPELMRRHQPWLRKDAFANPRYTSYAMKLGFCATICYVAYNVMNWPGASTAMQTILIAGLASSGASNHKMLLRVAGATLGGVVLGLGCVIFIFPLADDAALYFAAIAIVTYLCAWTARGARLGYVGMQMAFSFYLVVFESFSTPTLLTPARDRVLGILMSLLVMWLVLHPLRYERSSERMRYCLTRLLQMTAAMIPLVHKGSIRRLGALRAEAAAMVVEMRAQAEMIPFEIAAGRAAEQATSELTLRASERLNQLYFEIINARLRNDEPIRKADTEDGWLALQRSLTALAALVDKHEGETSLDAAFADELGEHVIANYARVRAVCEQLALVE